MTKDTHDGGLNDFNPLQMLLRRKEQAGSLVKLANELDVNKGLISMALNNGYFAPQLKRAMGWPEYERVPVCAECGHAHTYDCQKHDLKGIWARRKDKRFATWMPAHWTEEQYQVYRLRMRAYHAIVCQEIESMKGDDNV